MRISTFVRDSVGEVARRTECADQMVHDFARPFARRFELFRGVIELRLGDLWLLGRADDQNDFALWIYAAVQRRQLVDATTPEFLELLCQLSRDNCSAFASTRLHQRLQGC